MSEFCKSIKLSDTFHQIFYLYQKCAKSLNHQLYLEMITQCWDELLLIFGLNLPRYVSLQAFKALRNIILLMPTTNDSILITLPIIFIIKQILKLSQKTPKKLPSQFSRAQTDASDYFLVGLLSNQ